MKEFINKFKIPTVLGLSIILLGLVSGLYLVLKEQIFLSKAGPDLSAQNITLSNLTEDSVVISWQTSTPTLSFLTFGQNNSNEQTVLDDRDKTTPKLHNTHYVTLKNLLPQTRYQYKIISNKTTSEIEGFETAKPLNNQTGYSPIIGSVLDGNIPLNEGIVYLIINDATIQSALIKTGGNFLIPLSKIRKANLTEIYPLGNTTIAKITVVSDKGTANMNIKLKPDSAPLAPLHLGQNIDLAPSDELPQPSPTLGDLDKYDLNNDSKANAADYAIMLLYMDKSGSNLKNKKVDINEDGVVNQKDLDLMSQRLKELGTKLP